MPSLSTASTPTTTGRNTPMGLGLTTTASQLTLTLTTLFNLQLHETIIPFIKITMTYLKEETLEYAKAWFESMGFAVDITWDTLYLVLEGCSVELSYSEVEARAEQWLNELNRKD